MKYLLIGLCFFTSISFAQTTTERKCQSASVVQVIETSKFGFSPSTVFVKKNDRVCLVFRVIDNSGYKSFTIAGHPIWASARPGKEEAVSFVVRKAGKFKINCGSYCSYAGGELVVMEESEFKGMEDEVNKWNSVKSRKNH